jgi:N utilization substance protein A
MIKIGTALFEACEELERERGISKEILVSSLCDAMVAAYKKHMHLPREVENIEAILDETTGEIGVFMTKLVVKKIVEQEPVVTVEVNQEGEEVEITDPGKTVEQLENEQITLADAKAIADEVEVGDEIKIEVTPDQFGRIAAQSAKQVITQRIREAERNLVLNEFLDKKGTLTTGIIQRVENRNVIINIGKTDAIMPQREQIPGEFYKPGNRLRVFVVNVKETNRLPQVIVSHGHAEIVRELFELEVPEIEDGIVEIKSISREAGFRTKIAVWSNDAEVDSVGACIGPRGSRIQTIVAELKNEKIDIVRYSDDPVEYIVNALSPARVVSVDILADDEYSREAMVVVPDDQLSLAIGREGQNVRLAHKLTGWKIDIKSVSQMEQIEADRAAQPVEYDGEELIQQDLNEQITEDVENLETRDAIHAESAEEISQSSAAEEDAAADAIAEEPVEAAEISAETVKKAPAKAEKKAPAKAAKKAPAKAVKKAPAKKAPAKKAAKKPE